ncbi:MAG: hypothetical protein NT007_09475 [Candidatus Kapabacteria bacterium]|nr:hypothetical protein [Candidatus Kapabacteria bacterium]
MTQILGQTWNSVLDLQDDRQDLIAHLIIDEIEVEKIWDNKFDQTNNKLSQLANNVPANLIAGKS